MNSLVHLFTMHTARSAAYDDHEEGPVPFVSNGFSDNGVVGLVKPLPKDRVYRFSGICVSAFAPKQRYKTAPLLPVAMAEAGWSSWRQSPQWRRTTWFGWLHSLTIR